ncbi:MAG TPA: Spy/CpxP family protein refolding chaperone [Terracidiphilus sp.]|nr:Spy/CpxP family protein refolding chaperone [Terracidiphilus sp.]
MRTLKTVRLILAIAGVLTAGSWAFAQGPNGPGMAGGFGQHRPPMERSFGFANGHFWNNPEVVKQLNLTDDQRKAMDGILQDHRMKLIDQEATLRKAEVAMIPLMKADTPDRAAIEAQIDKVVAARADLEKANALFLLDIRMQLKPEQWKQLQAMHQNRMRERGPGEWGDDGHRPGMGDRFRRPDGQFRRPQPPPPDGAPQQSPAPAPAPGSGTQQ